MLLAIAQHALNAALWTVLAAYLGYGVSFGVAAVFCRSGGEH